MATLNALNEFVAGNTAVADEVNENFDALAEFVTNDVVHRDGSQQMTGQLLLENASPTQNNHAARKKYVDDQITTLTSGQIHGPYLHATSWVSGDYDIDGTDAQTFASPQWANITFDHVVQDSANAYTLANGQFEAPKAGLYLVSLAVGGSANVYFSTRIMVGNDLNTAACYFGPRWNPSDVDGTANAVAPMCFSHVVRVGAANTLIRPQFNPSEAGTYRFGKTLTISWLHGL